METRDEEEALRLANLAAGRNDRRDSVEENLPPLVRILSPETGQTFDSETITLQYEVISVTGRKITRTDLLIDGRSVNVRGFGRADLDSGSIREVTVPVPAKDVTVSVIAYTGDIGSEAATIQLAYEGRSVDDLSKPVLYGLLVGVSDYEDDELDLTYADRDAADLERQLLSQKGGLYRDVILRVMTNEEATGEAILDGLDWLERQVGQQDMGLLFMAGHGITDSKLRFYFLPHDGDSRRLRRSAIHEGDIQDVLSNLAGKALFFLDACHAGEGLAQSGTRRRGGADLTRVIQEFSSSENGVITFGASTGRQVSQERDEWRNGAFTEALLEAFGGSADLNRDGAINLSEMQLYLADRVKTLTNGEQHPVVSRPPTIRDFNIAVVR